MSTSFARQLLAWNSENNQREMPWKGEKNPYYIWLSEIILQQTRVEQGLPYFVRFKDKYPTVKHLAMAREDDVMKLWQGLGYYSRARNLHETAKNIHQNYKGKFPKTYEELRKLKGVGDYTASAIVSFAFGERKAVVDGNVIRVLSRVFGVKAAFDTAEGKKQFASLAQELIDGESPGPYNQAIMDFGALVCTPQNPECDKCPFAKRCVAKNEGIVEELPLRKKKTIIIDRHFIYLVITNGKEIFIQKRTRNDIWKNMYELPLIEAKSSHTKSVRSQIAALLGQSNFDVSHKSQVISQLLSHRKIHFRFMHIQLNDFDSLQLPNTKRIKIKALSKLAFPRTVHLYLSGKFLL